MKKVIGFSFIAAFTMLSLLNSIPIKAEYSEYTNKTQDEQLQDIYSWFSQETQNAIDDLNKDQNPDKDYQTDADELYSNTETTDKYSYSNNDVINNETQNISSTTEVNTSNYKDVTIIVNGKMISEKGIIKDSRTLIPLRGVFEELGYSTRWYPDEKLAILDSQERFITIMNGNTYFKSVSFIDQSQKYITPDVPQQIIDGHFYIPLRAVADAIGANVEWDGNNFIVKITGTLATPIS